MIRIEDYDYQLPEELIAQEALKKRDECRLMIVVNKLRITNPPAGRAGDKLLIKHRKFFEIADELGENDVLVLNESRVFPARLLGKKESGGKVEILLLRKVSGSGWEAISRPGLKIGQKLKFGSIGGEVVEKQDETVIVKFDYKGDFWKILEKIGKTPIPPYIHNNKERELRRDYQTVYAANYGSAAAPTAGLHFTDELLEKLVKNGVQIEKVNLNVGLGTFKPISEKNLETGKLHAEFLEIKEEVAKRLNLAKIQGKRIIAVGTTAVRVLETMSDGEGKLRAGSGETSIFIFPPYKFKFVDSLITNFHLPKSSLLMLIAAMMGEEWRVAYELAVKNKYRFFSFGDAMWIR